MEPGFIIYFSSGIWYFLLAVNSIKIMREYDRGVIFRLGRC